MTDLFGGNSKGLTIISGDSSLDFFGDSTKVEIPTMNFNIDPTFDKKEVAVAPVVPVPIFSNDISISAPSVPTPAPTAPTPALDISTPLGSLPRTTSAETIEFKRGDLPAVHSASPAAPSASPAAPSAAPSSPPAAPAPPTETQSAIDSLFANPSKLRTEPTASPSPPATPFATTTSGREGRGEPSYEDRRKEMYSTYSNGSNASMESRESVARSERSDRTDDIKFRDENEEKIYYAIKLQTLENDYGVKLSRDYKGSLSSYSVSQLRMEYKAKKNEIDKRSTIDFYRDVLIMCVGAVEYSNHHYDPFGIDLDGWAWNVFENSARLDRPLERLYKKWGGVDGVMAPELELAITLIGSGAVYHQMKKRSSGDGGGGGGGGLFGMLGQMMGMGGMGMGGMGMGGGMKPPAFVERAPMQGPTTSLESLIGPGGGFSGPAPGYGGGGVPMASNYGAAPFAGQSAHSLNQHLPAVTVPQYDPTFVGPPGMIPRKPPPGPTESFSRQQEIQERMRDSLDDSLSVGSSRSGRSDARTISAGRRKRGGGVVVNL